LIHFYKRDNIIMASALASLTANYTDSEGEDEQEAGGGLHPSLADLNRMVIKDARRSPNGDVDTPGSSGSSSAGVVRHGSSAAATPTKKAKLVSYIDPDAGLSDEEREVVPMDLESEDEENENEHNPENPAEEDEKNTSHCMEELWEGGVQLPPEPRGECSRELQGDYTEPSDM